MLAEQLKGFNISSHARVTPFKINRTVGDALKMSSFIHEDGKGNMLDDQGNEVFVVDMEVDDETYPLENVTDLNQYLSLIHI